MFKDVPTSIQKSDLQIYITTCNPLFHSNETFLINLALSNHMAISWTLKSTTATCFTMGNNWGSLPCDAPLLPFLMNINSEKMAGKIGGKVWVNCTESSLIYYVSLWLLYM